VQRPTAGHPSAARGKKRTLRNVRRAASRERDSAGPGRVAGALRGTGGHGAAMGGRERDHLFCQRARRPGRGTRRPWSHGRPHTATRRRPDLVEPAVTTPSPFAAATGPRRSRAALKDAAGLVGRQASCRGAGGRRPSAGGSEIGGAYPWPRHLGGAPAPGMWVPSMSESTVAASAAASSAAMCSRKHGRRPPAGRLQGLDDRAAMPW